jgi:periplasmic protein TonB
MRQAKTKKQNNWGMSGALVCAALLHIALVIAIDRFAHFTDNSLSSPHGKSTRIQLSLAQTKPKPKPETQSAEANSPSSGTDKKETSPSQPKDRVHRNSSAASATTAQPPPPSEQTEIASNDKTEVKQAAQSAEELSSTDEISMAHRQLLEGLTQSSKQPPARQSTTGRAETQQQEFTLYLQQLIEEKRRYPRAARRRDIEGSVEFSVYVSRAGALAELTLNSSSGSRILDKAAEDLLERVFPVDYPLQENVRTTIRIIYKLTEV